MPIGMVQLVATLQNQSLMPADVTQNTFHVYCPVIEPSAAEANAMCSIIANDFYINASGQTKAIQAWLSAEVARTAAVHKVEAYYTQDLTGNTNLGSPISSLSFAMPAATDPNPLPEEVSVVLSYHADLTDVPVTEPNPTPPPAVIRPQQRRRGRIFVGPLGVLSGAVQSGDYRPAAAFRTDLGLALERVHGSIIAQAVGLLAVWSKADATGYPVVGCYVDNAWDTQRRRGLAPTSRTSNTF